MQKTKRQNTLLQLYITWGMQIWKDKGQVVEMDSQCPTLAWSSQVNNKYGPRTLLDTMTGHKEFPIFPPSLHPCIADWPVWPTGGPPSTVWTLQRPSRSSSPVRPASPWPPPAPTETSASHPDRRTEKRRKKTFSHFSHKQTGKYL